MQVRAQSGRGAVRAAGCTAALAAASALSGLASAAAAQGFGLNEIGTCAIGRGFAVTGAPCDDASVLYWNPGAVAHVPRGLSAYVGGSAIQVRGSFTRDRSAIRDDSDVPVAFPPFAGVTWKGRGTTTSRLALGVAAYVPYGLTSQWGSDFPGRFAAQRASLQALYVQPTVAFDLVPGRVSVGGGAVIGHSRLELRQSLDLAQQLAPAPAPAGTRFAQLGIANGTEFARARVEGSSNVALGYHLGALLRVAPTVSVGARYLSEVAFEYDDAEATFEQVATNVSLIQPNPLNPSQNVPVPLDVALAGQFAGSGLLRPGQTASTRIDHPAQLQIGIGFTGLPRTTLSADYARTFWHSFDTLPVNFAPLAGGQPSPLTRTLLEEYEDIDSYRVGLEHRFAGAPFGGVAGRLGFSYAESPAPDQTVTPLLPDMPRYNFAIGAGIPLGRRLALDAAYLRVETEGRRGRTDERAATLSAERTVGELNNGFYALNANIFSVSLKARF